MASQRAAARLEDQIASLGDLSRHELVERWQAHFKTPPPELTATRLKRMTDLPHSWEEQRQILGFS